MDTQDQLINDLMQDAIVLHNDGNLAKAKELYTRILSLSPDHVQAMNYMALLAQQVNRPDIAIKYLKKLIRIQPENPFFYSNLGEIFSRNNRLDEAITCFNKAISIKSDISFMYNNLCIAQKKKGNFSEAIKAGEKAIEIDPESAAAYAGLGDVFRLSGHIDKAEETLKKALAKNPDYPEALNSLGNLMLMKENSRQAISLFSKAIKLKPNDSSLHTFMGMACRSGGDNAGAIEHLKKALNINPKNKNACYQLGYTYHMMQRYDEAIEFYTQAISLQPAFFRALNNLGIVYYKAGNYNKALECYQISQNHFPDSEDTYVNMGEAYRALGKIEEAANCFEHAINIRPDMARANWNLAHIKLLTGNYTEGWNAYEWRFKRPETHCRYNHVKRWDGRIFKNKLLLVHAEQGIGDTFQFIRYLPMVKEMGGKVIFECQQGLLSVLQNCKGLDEIREQQIQENKIPNIDFQVSLMSLPCVFNTTIDTIPCYIPYITADSHKVKLWQNHMKATQKIRIGIVWAGNPTHENDKNRSCKLVDFISLAENTNIGLFSLQKDKTPSDNDILRNTPHIRDLGKDISDFSDTAAIIENLDLIISVDTAVAHLAGAMGKPVWVLLPFAPDWRWMLHREDSPWYPLMTLFRQPRPGDWQTVFHLVRDCLSTFHI